MTAPFGLIGRAFIMSSVAAGSAVAQSYTTAAIEADGVTEIVPYAVNNHGVVVGSAKFGEHYGAFRWEDGTLIELELPAGTRGAIARDINDHGVIVGGVGYPNRCMIGKNQGAFWEATRTSSTITLLDFDFDRSVPPGEMNCGRGSIAYGVNNEGLIVGGAVKPKTDPFGTERRRLVPATSADGTWIEVIHPRTDDVTEGWAWQVNDDGLVMGKGVFGPDRAFIANGSSAILDIEPGFHGLNNLGHVVGASAYVDVITPQVARMWDGEGYIDLDSTNSEAIAVNDSDIAVGRRVGVGSFGLPYHFGVGMLYRPGAPPIQLTAVASAGWAIRSANDINNEGMIVGVGELNGERTAFWMAPVAGAFLLEGTVTDANGAPVPDATVVLRRAVGG